MDKLIYRQARIEEIYRLRFAVLRPGLVPEVVHFAGDAEDPPATWHVGAFAAAGGENVGCLTLFQSPWEGAPAYQLRGMAVAEGWRGCGVGRALIACALELLGADPALGRLPWWCNARTEAVGFYEQLGWRVVSPEFMIEGVGPHRKMLRGDRP